MGSTTTGGGQMPLLDEEWIKIFQPPSDLRTTKMSELADSLNLSFAESPLLVKAKVIELKNKHWVGPVFLQADSLILVGKDAYLDGAVLQAPQIEIDTGFIGRLQAMVDWELVVGTEVDLRYPSVLALNYTSQNINTPRPRVRIGKGSHIEGFILGLNPHDNDHHPMLSLDEAGFSGRIVWQGGVEANGKMEGSLYCDNFFYRGKGGQFYFNYLVNFIVDGTSRSNHWVEPMCWPNGEQKVVQWLD